MAMHVNAWVGKDFVISIAIRIASSSLSNRHLPPLSGLPAIFTSKDGLSALLILGQLLGIGCFSRSRLRGTDIGVHLVDLRLQDDAAHRFSRQI